MNEDTLWRKSSQQQFPSTFFASLALQRKHAQGGGLPPRRGECSVTVVCPWPGAGWAGTCAPSLPTGPKVMGRFLGQVSLTKEKNWCVGILSFQDLVCLHRTLGAASATFQFWGDITTWRWGKASKLSTSTEQLYHRSNPNMELLS